MANPLLLDIVKYLQTNNLVEGDGVDAFRDFLPEAPDNLVTLYEYSSLPVVNYETAVNRSVQILVRNSNSNSARELALEIYKSLYSTSTRIDFTPDRFAAVYIRQTPFKLRIDESNRTIYCFNIGVTTSID